MDDLHWFKSFIHIFLFNVVVFALFYAAFFQPMLHNSSNDIQPQNVIR